MSDLIRREDAIKAYNEAMDELVKWQMEEWQLGDFSECEFNTTDCKHIVRKLEAIPSADTDISEYSDRLWKNVYERGKADRPQGWIPCSERLPEEKESVYLVCTDYGYLCSCRWTQDIYGLGAADEWSTWGWNHADVPQFSKVVAWMDLKPWKGADDE